MNQYSTQQEEILCYYDRLRFLTCTTANKNKYRVAQKIQNFNNTFFYS